MKDLVEDDAILGIKMTRVNNGLILSQSHYIEKVVKRFNNVDCKPVSTPFGVRLKLEKNTREPVSQLAYARVIGCLIYVMSYIRLDIAFFVGKLSRYARNLSHIYWHVVRRVLK